MTIEEEITSCLVNRGMFESDAAVVMAQAKESGTLSSMSGRWDHQIDDYPAVLVSVTRISVMDVALDWIIENKPHAFYRPLFEVTE